LIIVKTLFKRYNFKKLLSLSSTAIVWRMYAKSE